MKAIIRTNTKSFEVESSVSELMMVLTLNLAQNGIVSAQKGKELNLSGTLSDKAPKGTKNVFRTVINSFGGKVVFDPNLEYTTAGFGRTGTNGVSTLISTEKMSSLKIADENIQEYKDIIAIGESFKEKLSKFIADKKMIKVNFGIYVGNTDENKKPKSSKSEIKETETFDVANIDVATMLNEK